MLSFIQSWFAAGANPVGIDFGTESLRLAQVEKTGEDCRLIAAASAAVPRQIRHDAPARAEFLRVNLHDLWAGGNFRGRQAVLALPAADMYVQHLRLPRMDDTSIKKALPWESQGKLPIEPPNAILRHLVAGDIYRDQEPTSEIILLAARKNLVESLLEAAGKARLDIAGINIEPMAIIDCFRNIYRRKTDSELTNCFVDIGSSASRAIIARGGHIFFVRNLPVGGESFNQAVAREMNLSPEEARDLRYRQSTEARDAHPRLPPQGGASETDAVGVQTARRIRSIDTPDEEFFREKFLPDCNSAASNQNSLTLSGASAIASGAGTTAMAILETAASLRPRAALSENERIDRAVREPVAKLAEELSLCRRYHEATFPDHPIDRLIFVGAEARQRELCAQVARKVGISAQMGDPLVRMGRTTDVRIDSGIDRRLPQPAWAVAIGLSMGSLGSNAT